MRIALTNVVRSPFSAIEPWFCALRAHSVAAFAKLIQLIANEVLSSQHWGGPLRAPQSTRFGGHGMLHASARRTAPRRRPPAPLKLLAVAQARRFVSEVNSAWRMTSAAAIPMVVSFLIVAA